LYWQTVKTSSSVHKTQRNLLLEGAKNMGEGWKVPPIPAEVFKVNAKDLKW
jgi:hypothetical protein